MPGARHGRHAVFIYHTALTTTNYAKASLVERHQVCCERGVNTRKLYRMNSTNTYQKIGVVALIGLLVFVSCDSQQNHNAIDMAEKQTDNRNLKLTVSSGFEGNEKIISSNASREQIESTMNSIDWKEFHIVQLEDQSGSGFKALHVSGSLAEDGLASGFVTDDAHILMEKPIQTVEQMTEILLAFLEGEEHWRSNYEYK